MSGPTAASAALERLNVFVGAWHTVGEIHTPSGKREKFTATDNYEWLPGGYFLLHRFKADMPDATLEGIEVIGYNPESNSYPMHSFDSAGEWGVMQARLANGTWTFTGHNIRFTGSFHDNGKRFAGLWETRSRDGGAWQPWMSVSLLKVE